MTQFPTPEEIRPINADLQRETVERERRERAEEAMDAIGKRIRRDGIPPGGMRYDVPAWLRSDAHACSMLEQRLRASRWQVIKDPDDEDDDICHGYRIPKVLLICFPTR